MLKNIEIRGSTMGSRREFRDMVHFVSESKIRPVVSKVVSGLRDLDAVEALFEVMRDGKQFGKLVLQIADPEPDSRPPPKL
jgi:D-arabinose 1-dehydrogenase-like Zn-dependent alcohol dehydrogenase